MRVLVAALRRLGYDPGRTPVVGDSMTPLSDSAYAGAAGVPSNARPSATRAGVRPQAQSAIFLRRIGMSGNLLIEPSTPQPQELRQKKVGHFVVDTGHDRPWSQYFCCVLTANRDFVSKYPIATKRALRAFLKGADMCAKEPQRVAPATGGQRLRTTLCNGVGCPEGPSL